MDRKTIIAICVIILIGLVAITEIYDSTPAGKEKGFKRDFNALFDLMEEGELEEARDKFHYISTRNVSEYNMILVYGRKFAVALIAYNEGDYRYAHDELKYIDRIMVYLTDEHKEFVKDMKAKIESKYNDYKAQYDEEDRQRQEYIEQMNKNDAERAAKRKEKEEKEASKNTSGSTSGGYTGSYNRSNKDKTVEPDDHDIDTYYEDYEEEFEDEDDAWDDFEDNEEYWDDY